MGHDTSLEFENKIGVSEFQRPAVQVPFPHQA